MLQRTLVIAGLALILLFTGCSQRYSRSYDPATPEYSISGNLYQNTAYGFIMIAPNSDWTYAGAPAEPLIVRPDTGTVARFTKELTPTITAFVEVAIWDISGIVTPGMFTSDIASLNADLIAADSLRFPSHTILTAVTSNTFNDIYAFEHEFTAYAQVNAVAVQNRYRCVGFREQTEDHDWFFVLIGGTASEDWGSRSSELNSFMTSFHYN